MSDEDDPLHDYLAEIDRVFTASLEEVRRQFDANDDSWRHSMLRTMRNLIMSIGVERRLIEPIEHMRQDDSGAYLLNARMTRDEAFPVPNYPTCSRLPSRSQPSNTSAGTCLCLTR